MRAAKTGPLGCGHPCACTLINYDKHRSMILRSDSRELLPDCRVAGDTSDLFFFSFSFPQVTSLPSRWTICFDHRHSRDPSHRWLGWLERKRIDPSTRENARIRASRGSLPFLFTTLPVYVSQCVENCLASNYTKPGYCPERTAMTPFEAACLVACVDDSRCSDLAKCCSHDCGITCMHPVGLDDRKGE